jgi:hypothetical protein
MLKLEKLEDAKQLIERILNDTKLVDSNINDSNMKKIFPLTVKYFKEASEKYKDNEIYKDIMNKLTELEQKNELNKIDLEELAIKYYYSKEDKIEKAKPVERKDEKVTKQKTKETNIIKPNENKKATNKPRSNNLDSRHADMSTHDSSQSFKLHDKSKMNQFVELFEKTYLNTTDKIPMQILTKYTFCLLSIVSFQLIIKRIKIFYEIS